jgi:5-formyltetrahydrofolate cyclo-ligase
MFLELYYTAINVICFKFNCIRYLHAVALAYSEQIMEEGIIPVTPTDMPIDAIVSSDGVIPISPVAKEKMS